MARLCAGMGGVHGGCGARQGYMDPLSFMDFKVLPESLAQVKDAAEFATAPVGSGPFRYSKDKSRAGEEVVFEANPYYANRQGKIGLPRIREIHFIVSKDRQKDFTKGREQGQMCLLLDLPTARIKEVSTIPEVSVLPKMRNRRIYFLAVNNRSTVLRSQPLRRAIAHGINREQILTDVFRDGNADFHRPLNGPYPRYSWACRRIPSAWTRPRPSCKAPRRNGPSSARSRSSFPKTMRPSPRRAA
ncbi:MAG: hypothetical protein E6K70_24600 [Planctomycetota bacterium]|nr:MAG: hypothetical protein E6K70_24600 [Planctomycetota bacterium]